MLTPHRYWDNICTADASASCPFHFSTDEIELHNEDTKAYEKMHEVFEARGGIMRRDGWTSHETYNEAVGLYARLSNKKLGEIANRDGEHFERLKSLS